MSTKSAKDPYTCLTVKYKELYFGNKDQVKVNVDNKNDTDCSVIDTTVHDSQSLIGLIGK